MESEKIRVDFSGIRLKRYIIEGIIVFVVPISVFLIFPLIYILLGGRWLYYYGETIRMMFLSWTFPYIFPTFFVIVIVLYFVWHIILTLHLIAQARTLKNKQIITRSQLDHINNQMRKSRIYRSVASILFILFAIGALFMARKISSVIS